jgi:hypothetical protein
MTDPWLQAARNFTDEEKETALRNLLENNPQDAEAGIIRQLLGDGKKPLSPDQQEVYERYIEPGLAEKCGFASCGRFVPAGVDYCGTCEIESLAARGSSAPSSYRAPCWAGAR